MQCLLCRVTGRVQGVFFRASTQREARRLGVTGFARNLRDGSVEVLACGESAAVAALKEWLYRGPPQARVSAVSCEAVAHQAPPDFSTG